jgi:hypothetical protein
VEKVKGFEYFPNAVTPRVMPGLEVRGQIYLVASIFSPRVMPGSEVRSQGSDLPGSQYSQSQGHARVRRYIYLVSTPVPGSQYSQSQGHARVRGQGLEVISTWSVHQYQSQGHARVRSQGLEVIST